MTEAEWLTGQDPETLYMALRNEMNSCRTRWHGWRSVRRFRVSDRKLRLYCCACCQRIVDLIPEEVRPLLVVAQRWAEGQAEGNKLWDAMETAERVHTVLGLERADHELSAPQLALLAVTSIFIQDSLVSSSVIRASSLTGERCEGRDLVELLHDIVGNPFQPKRLEPPWQSWKESEILPLAQATYEDQTFDHLPILADALEDANCTDAELLGHLRGRGPHTRGCWALDVVLSKE
jgi:hypothetical protein